MITGFDEAYIKQQIEYWNDMLQIFNQIDEKRIKTENTNKLFESMNNISSENSQSVYLKSNTSTVPIIDSYKHSQNQYLIIKRRFLVFADDSLWSISLVISKILKPIFILKSGLTMTDLKQSHISAFKQEEYKAFDHERLGNLMSSIANIPPKEFKHNTYIPFPIPCQFNAQAEDNRRGYGWDWTGGWGTEGTLYGECTKFAIIGIYVK